MKLSDNTQYKLVVTGDLDCDGEITVNDLAKMKMHIIGIEKLTDLRLEAGKIDKDNQVSVNDLAQIKLILLGLK